MVWKKIWLVGGIGVSCPMTIMTRMSRMEKSGSVFLLCLLRLGE